MPKLKANPDWLRANFTAPRVGVDRENKVILGYVVAQEGPFRETDPRGEFDQQSLSTIVQLMTAKQGGLKSRFGHPSLSSDAVGTSVGRARDPYLDSVRVERDGRIVELRAVRANLHLDPSAFEANPNGNLGEYLMTVAESDRGLISSSLVLQVDEEYRLNKDGTPQTDKDGVPLPPLWRPTVLHASDITDEGAAVDNLLSTGGANRLDGVVREACKMLDSVFMGQDRDVVEERCRAWLGRYLEMRFPRMARKPTPHLDAVRLKMERMSLLVREGR